LVHHFPPLPAKSSGMKDEATTLSTEANKQTFLRKFFIRATVIGIAVGFCFLLGEIALRIMLFGNPESFKGLKEPGQYASVYSDEYWKLTWLWKTDSPPPKHPHPLLGWYGNYSPSNFMHWEYGNMWKKRPVLLYGDSFSQCVPASQCFETILNADSAFSANHYLLNYGTGGFGLDQILLLCKETAHKFEKPFVVFGLLTSDLDRSILKMRIGQKPYFEESGDSLRLAGIPISENTDSFFKANPPRIKSYLWRKLIFSQFNFLNWRINPRVRGDLYYEAKIRSLNEKILEEAIAHLKNLNVDFTFLIFHHEDRFMTSDESGNWRDTFLLRVLNENHVPYIWSKDVVRADQSKPYQYTNFILEGDGHPTTYFNTLISAEIKKRVLDAEKNGEPYVWGKEISNAYEKRIKEVIDGIYSEPEWLAKVQTQATDKKISLEQCVWENAVYVVSRE
jgi:hypothetical protein